MFTIRKSWKVEMAHRLTTAYTKACSDCIHGHTYTIEVFIRAMKLDESGMVIDFGALGALKEIVMHCDHALMIEGGQNSDVDREHNRKLICVPFNPTAENMARYLLEVVAPHVLADLESALQIAGKAERESRIDEIKDAMKGALGSDGSEFAGSDKELSAAYRSGAYAC